MDILKLRKTKGIYYLQSDVGERIDQWTQQNLNSPIQIWSVDTWQSYTGNSVENVWS